MKKVLIIVGPTSVGKTAMSVELAKQLNGEIISGDSIQVYRKLDIGSAKVTKEEMQGIPHYLIDCLEIEDNYSVFEFQQQARKLIDCIWEKGKLPIVCGGTGLYIKSLIYDYEFQEQNEVDFSEYDSLTNDQLYARLQQKDPSSANAIHPNNRRRVMRSLWICEHQETSKSEMESKQNHELIYDAYVLGLTCERSILYNRINMRVDKMVENGLLDEIQELTKIENVFQYQGLRGIGYKEFEPYFKNETSLEECIEAVKKNSRNFAKRQYTWFNNQMDVHWFDIFEEGYKERIKEDLGKWLEKEN